MIKHVFNFGKRFSCCFKLKSKNYSSKCIPLNAEYTVQEITFERLLDVINKFGEVAKCSVEAGFDFLEFIALIIIYHSQCFLVEQSSK